MSTLFFLFVVVVRLSCNCRLPNAHHRDAVTPS